MKCKDCKTETEVGYCEDCMVLQCKLSYQQGIKKACLFMFEKMMELLSQIENTKVTLREDKK